MTDDDVRYVPFPLAVLEGGVNEIAAYMRAIEERRFAKEGARINGDVTYPFVLDQADACLAAWVWPIDNEELLREVAKWMRVQATLVGSGEAKNRVAQLGAALIEVLADSFRDGRVCVGPHRPGHECHCPECYMRNTLS
jgi:hypothetical protein